MRLILLLLGSLVGCSGDPAPPSVASPIVGTPLARPVDGIVHAAGSGAMVPLGRALAAAWAARGGSPRLVVEASIGSAGGVRAAADGAVDVGLVSRALNDEERGLGLEEVPLGRDVILLAANPEAAFDRISSDDLCALYRGAHRLLADGGHAVLLLRDRGESANGVLDRAIPCMAGAREAALADGNLRVLYHDAAMVEAIASTPRALGVSNLGSLVASHAPLRTLALDGRRPSLEAVADGSWPLQRPLALVARRDRVERLRPLLAFIASDEGRAITRAAGYLPPTGTRAP